MRVRVYVYERVRVRACICVRAAGSFNKVPVVFTSTTQEGAIFNFQACCMRARYTRVQTTHLLRTCSFTTTT